VAGERENHTSGPEGHIQSVSLMPGLKPRPTARTSFPGACKARTFHRVEYFGASGWGRLSPVRAALRDAEDSRGC